jgi:hypothetical protein
VYNKPFHRRNGATLYADPINFFGCQQSAAPLSEPTHHAMNYKCLVLVYRFVVWFKSYCHHNNPWFSIKNDGNQPMDTKPISPRVMSLLTQFWFIVVYYVLIRSSIFGFCSACVWNHLLSSIPWLVVDMGKNRVMNES